MNKKIYFENLDGLRFFCFLSVFFYHSFYTTNAEIHSNSIYLFIKNGLFSNGNIGVNFFFVLSGFLISFLLISEKKETNTINLPYFYFRRVLRIWPLYFFCVFFGFVVFPYLKAMMGQIPSETANIYSYLFFYNNFDFIKNGPPDASILGVLWSVAIEEQFYLFWPVIVLLVPVKKLWIPFSLIILISWIFRAAYNIPVLHEYHTLSCIGDMAIGGMGAWLIQQSENFKLFIKNLSLKQIVVVYIIFFTCFFFRERLLYSNEYIRIFERSLIALLIILIILEQCYSNRSFFKMHKFKLFSKLGIISYGLYCFHFIGILITITAMKILSLDDQLWHILLLETVASLFISIMISHFSYKYFESFFLNFKKRFELV